MEKEAERLKKSLEGVSAIKKLATWAFPEQEVRVTLDLEKSAQMRITLERVLASIQSANVNIPGGSIDVGSKRFNIQTSGNYQSLADIRNTIIHSSGAKIVYLRDVADVHFDYEDNNYYMTIG